ncbi:hypothetical protein BMEI0531 [Brucella melitensis bv. 1 str. 16M]|uniref:Uncharacterized protein n=1 Tax=Brucella melitensis biotype 1 (strain ATCC 23456 / CCUG 17765 / NCTC 10094 / 16M) TaxID=224914 RepID=Q8YIB3_BRUME|nr:hypothetical protein BMEI0531 [Brucella melitensis bv. 1 str. 16M]AVM30478.1 hypothetical protein CUC12_03855 [Brucella melitensis]EEW86458.1 predicted protein [Brucella melitensis bv. 1 str. 16M]HAJ67250.1 hypothetical protein [Brucella melitensis]HAK21653.1 hypothetical protein [Brucella melitensis]
MSRPGVKQKPTLRFRPTPCLSAGIITANMDGDYHRFIVFPVRTIVIASLMLHIQSDSSDSGLKSESFITTLHSQAS